MSRNVITLEELVSELLDESEEDDDVPGSGAEIESSSSESDLSELGDNFETNCDGDPLYVSKDGINWRSEPYVTRRLGGESVIRLRPGGTRYASSRVNNIRDSFLLLFPSTLSKIIIDCSNDYGKHFHGTNHIEIDDELHISFVTIEYGSGKNFEIKILSFQIQK